MPNVRTVRGRRACLVLAVTVLAVVGAWAVPARAQLSETTTTSTEASTSSTSDITILPTTSTSEDVTTTTVRRTTTTVRRTTTTTVLVPGPTVPATTTTSELREAPGPVQMPTTTSLPPPKTVDRGLGAGTIVSLVIAGLLLIALVLSVFTWRYWLATRPVPPTVAEHG